MPSRSVQRHDQFFQTLLDKPGTAAALLSERLPPEVAALLSDEPPELVPGTFVSQRLRAYRTDRLYRTRTKTDRPVLVWTLIEHKSAPEPRIALQLLGYQHQILEHWDRTEGRASDGSLNPLPALVTMVVYNGAADWTVPLSLGETTDAEPEMRPYLLDFRYSLVDLGRIPDAQLSRERALRVGLLILKHGPLRRATRKRLLKLAREALQLGHEDLATMIYYLLGDLVDDPRGELARSILSELVPGEEDRVMSLIAEQWKAEGFNLGMLKGRAEGKADLLVRQLRRRFGTLPDHVEHRVRSVETDLLDAWSERIFDARTLEEVFADAGPEQ